jgi:tetratricopeptide (TPR) repeat protein
LEDYEAAMKITPTLVEAHVGRASIRVKSGAYQDAVDECEAALEQNPRNADAYFYRAKGRDLLAEKSSLRKELRQSAAEDLKQALQVAPVTWSHRQEAEDMLQRLK